MEAVLLLTPSEVAQELGLTAEGVRYYDTILRPHRSREGRRFYDAAVVERFKLWRSARHDRAAGYRAMRDASRGPR